MTPAGFRLIPFRSPLLRESLLLSFPRVTEMFQFTRFPLPALCIQTGVTPHDGCRVSPFGHPRVVARSAAHRGISQLPTSFFGSSRQGIHRWLLVAWKYRSSTIDEDAHVRCAVLKGLSPAPKAGRGVPHLVETGQRPKGCADTPSKRDRGRNAKHPLAGSPRWWYETN